MSSEGSKNQEVEVVDGSEERLLHPNILLYLDFVSLINLGVLNKKFLTFIKEEATNLGYWPAVCNSFCAHYGLFSPVIVSPDSIIPGFNYRQHLFTDLWPIRRKWNASETDKVTYKVKVSCRFRPGEPPAGRVCLPLHQFLRLRRQQKSKTGADGKKSAGDVEDEKEVFVGERDPEEFVDPLLGGLMRDPVLLAPSNRIVDRTVAVQCVLRGGRDPFTGQRLTMGQIVAQPELASRIQAWRNRPERKDISLDIHDVKGLVDVSEGVNQEFLDALLEVEQLQAVLRRAQIDSNSTQYANTAVDDNNNTAVPQQAEDAAVNVVNDDVTVGLVDFTTVMSDHDAESRFAINNLMQRYDSDAMPHTNHEVARNEVSRVVEVNPKHHFISMHVPGTGVRPFHFSHVYPGPIQQREVYNTMMSDFITAALNGSNACVLCYGQTGSGKTYSFLGPEQCLEQEELRLNKLQLEQAKREAEKAQEKSSVEFSLPFASALQPEEELLPSTGILLRSAQEFFRARLALQKQQNIALSITVQIVEVYEEKITDLLTGRQVQARRDNGAIVHGSEHVVETLLEFLSLYKIAYGRQKFAETAMNTRSSRAHTLVIFHLTQQHSSSSSSELLINSSLYLVDLAGSERIKKSQVAGQRLREAVGINSSLLVLGKVITALVEGSMHVPYLECKLTTLLRAAFGGNSRTMVMVNARPEEENGEETLQSLRFGERCGLISNDLKQMAMSKESTMQALDAALLALQHQIESLTSRNKQHLDSFKALHISYEGLARRKKELLMMEMSGNNNGTAGGEGKGAAMGKV